MSETPIYVKSKSKLETEQFFGSTLVNTNNMKRINPITNEPFRAGDVREDGFIFRTYEKHKILDTGFYKESWLSPAAYKRFKEQSSKAIKKCNRDKLKERLKFISNYKMSRGCERCGYKEHSCALDFAHRDPQTKKFTISKILTRNLKTIETEIAKCRILCSNCHRLETHGVIKFN